MMPQQAQVRRVYLGVIGLVLSVPFETPLAVKGGEIEKGARAAVACRSFLF
jgi:hypothetical protein